MIYAIITLYNIHRISNLVTHHKVLLIIRERGSVHFQQWNTRGIWIGIYNNIVFAMAAGAKPGFCLGGFDFLFKYSLSGGRGALQIQLYGHEY